MSFFPLPFPSSLVDARAMISSLAGLPGSLALVTALNVAFERFPEGLDSLEGKRVCMHTTDLGLRAYLTLRGQAFVVCHPVSDPDVLIRASAADFFRLASRKADADTLFFARRLLIEGDTEAGLLLKNALDALDLARLLHNPPALHRLLAVLRASFRGPAVKPWS
ncbi:MAG: SCP2 sterol-binding domain-containing protein [Burkholderiales bacterium]